MTSPQLSTSSLPIEQFLHLSLPWGRRPLNLGSLFLLVYLCNADVVAFSLLDTTFLRVQKLLYFVLCWLVIPPGLPLTLFFNNFPFFFLGPLLATLMNRLVSPEISITFLIFA